MLRERIQTWLPALVVFLGFSFAASTSSLSLTDLAIALTATAAGAMWILSRHWLWPLDQKDQIFGIYFGLIILLGTFFLPFDQTSFGLITLYLLGLFFVVRYLNGRGHGQLLFKSYTVGAIVSALTGVGWWFFAATGSNARYSFVFDDPNVYGAFLVPATLFLLWRVLSKKTEMAMRWLGLSGLSLLYVALALTVSRGAWLQLVVATLVLVGIMTIRREFDHFSIKTIGGGLAVLALVLTLSSTTLSELPIDRASSSDQGRIDNLHYALDTIADFSMHQFIIGRGNGSYELFSPDHFSAHNTYLRLLFENGVLGLGLFILFVSLAIIRRRHELTSPHVAIVVAALAGILVHSLFIDTLHWRHFWLLLGLL